MAAAMWVLPVPLPPKSRQLLAERIQSPAHMAVMRARESPGTRLHSKLSSRLPGGNLAADQRKARRRE